MNSLETKSNLTKSRTSVFEKLTSLDYFSKKHANLPSIKLSSQDTGHEVKIERNGLSAKSSTPTTSTAKKMAPTSTAKTATPPCFQKRMNLKLHMTPQESSRPKHRIEPSMNINNNGTSDLNCTYKLKENNSTVKSASKNMPILKLKESNDYNSKCSPKIAFNLNLALNMDGKENEKSKEKHIETISNLENYDDTNDKTASIQVAVRMRPFSPAEKLLNDDNEKNVRFRNNRVLVLHKNKNEVFQFDHCLDSSSSELFNYASQDVVFRKMGEPLLDYSLKGYNTCLFAYGQSGSGKTYTMMGTKDVPGIIPRFLNELFKRITSTLDIEFIVNISFLEIYNEKIHDLLSDEFTMEKKNLRVREHPQTGQYVEDLSVFTVDDYDIAMKLLETGLSRRSTASTKSNEKSSRSHSIFSIILVQNKKFENLDQSSNSSETSCISKINLVDLAGSERDASTNIDRAREGNSINKSLLTLGKVITQLAEQSNSGNKQTHIPFRDSVLTFLLKDCFGGNSRTSMIANISPSRTHIDETLSTLRYASTAQKVVNIVHINEDPKMKIINSLLRQISFLKKEVEKPENSDDSEKDSSLESICSSKCVDHEKKVCSKLKKLNQKFDNLLMNHMKLIEDFDQMRSNFSYVMNEVEVPELESEIVDQLRNLVKETEETKLFNDKIDYESIMESMEYIDDELINDKSKEHFQSKSKYDDSKSNINWKTETPTKQSKQAKKQAEQEERRRKMEKDEEEKRKQKEEAERKRKEEESERKQKEEEAERKRKEEEVKRERILKEKADIEKKEKEEAEAKRIRQEEEERKEKELKNLEKKVEDFEDAVDEIGDEPVYDKKKKESKKEKRKREEQERKQREEEEEKKRLEDEKNKIDDPIEPEEVLSNDDDNVWCKKKKETKKERRLREEQERKQKKEEDEKKQMDDKKVDDVDESINDYEDAQEKLEKTDDIDEKENNDPDEEAKEDKKSKGEKNKKGKKGKGKNRK
ncbi:cerebellar granular layer structural organization [Blomia tropicalis]|nr:cerebellar granular layer structural organization [Blomia tropicalis]